MPFREFRPFRINALQATAAPIGNNVATTSATTITAGSNVVVTPASMANITVGRYLNFNGGTGSPEDVLVKAVTSTTFTADFVNNHSGAYVISSSRTVDLGHLTVNQAGTSIVITLYDGHPGAWVAGQAIAAISPNVSEPTRSYDIRCNRGLFYIVTGTTAGDYTVTYHDRLA
jgi:hypothetical protein